MKYLYIRAHCIPSQDPAVRAAIEAEHRVPDTIGEIKPAANLKDPEKIAADIARQTEKAQADLAEAKAKAKTDIERDWLKTAADGLRGHVAAIAAAIDDDEPISPIGLTASPRFADGIPEPVGVVFDDDKAVLPTAGMSRGAHLAPQRIVREPDAARERFPAAYRAARRAALEIYRAGGAFDPYLIPERCR